MKSVFTLKTTVISTKTEILTDSYNLHFSWNSRRLMCCRGIAWKESRERSTETSYCFLFELLILAWYNFHSIHIFSPDPTNHEAVGVCGTVETLNVKEFKVNQQEIPLQLSQHYMTEVRIIYRTKDKIIRCIFEINRGILKHRIQQQDPAH